ncbi:hypothetical protein SAMN06273572_103232 [Monaibacterium marinum]|uniref:Uncharacterized protein n=1 Tax=Pontivivens marinum TaxID=1690039 RepID=A0A2C9CSI1_9RHOB|nr:hypothetical protein [Monaibacterium marinum]SOH94202.1 hypothetical protein SAMN06273572_103232 [Monaibacterium marinum]
MTQTPRISLSFGAFACELEGVADPLPLLQRLVTFCEEVEQRNPDFGKTVVPLAEVQAALSTTGPVQAEVKLGRLVLTQPVTEVQADKGISSVEEIENQAVDLPDDALSSALDRAMQQTAQRDTGAARPILSLSEYARARRPRRIQDALEITAAYAHHMLNLEHFDGVTVLSDVDQVDIGRACTMDEKIEAFGEMLERGTFKTAPAENMFILARAVSLRYR